MHNLSYGNEFFSASSRCLENQTNFHMKSCAPGLVLKQRKKQLGNGLFVLTISLILACGVNLLLLRLGLASRTKTE